jgi:hypothetical protein
LWALAENRLKGWNFLEKLNDYQLLKNHLEVRGSAVG